MRRRFICAVLVLLCGVAGATGGVVAGQRELRVCGDPDNLPFSNRRQQGFENKIAQLIAKELHATVRYTWMPQRRGFIRRTLKAGACDLVMGVPGGMPGTAAALVAVVAMLPPAASWSATGVGRSTLPVALAALSAGGHLRVGMEDTLSLRPEVPVRDNRQLVVRAAALAELAQRPPMTPAAARQLMGVPVRRPAAVGRR